MDSGFWISVDWLDETVCSVNKEWAITLVNTGFIAQLIFQIYISLLPLSLKGLVLYEKRIVLPALEFWIFAGMVWKLRSDSDKAKRIPTN